MVLCYSSHGEIIHQVAAAIILILQMIKLTFEEAELSQVFTTDVLQR